MGVPVSRTILTGPTGAEYRTRSRTCNEANVLRELIGDWESGRCTSSELNASITERLSWHKPEPFVEVSVVKMDMERKIQCIKDIRTMTGWGLRTTKRFVDWWYDWQSHMYSNFGIGYEDVSVSLVRMPYSKARDLTRFECVTFHIALDVQAHNIPDVQGDYVAEFDTDSM